MIISLNKNETFKNPILNKENPEQIILNKNIKNKNIEIEDSSIIINDDELEILDSKIKNKEILKNKDNNSNESENLNKYIIINKNISEEEELRMNFLKNYSKLRPNINEKFLKRMEFDINNRNIKERKMNEFINKTKLKMKEENKIKSFNRLIEDANRRIEAKKNIILFNEQKIKVEEDNININNIYDKNKKYNKEEWKEIYKKRFGNYLDNKNKRIKEKIIEKEINEKKKEDYFINLNKSKKEPEKNIIKYCKKMYNNYMLKKAKILNKKNNLENFKNQNIIKKNIKNIKRNKSAGNKNIYMKNINNNTKDNNKKHIIRNNKCLTPYFNIKNKIEYKCKDGIHDEINCKCFGKGSIYEALIDNFFRNKKTK